jgi:hypothetical protein
VDVWLRPHLERSSRHERHPVMDFLFEYYAHRPSLLRRWSPGAGVELAEADAFLARREFERTAGGVAVRALPAGRRDGVSWTLRLMESTASRPAVFSCFGLHEWAMVYRCDERRHAAWPLRLGTDEVASAVEQNGVSCTHYDAFRFFTPAARPLNRTEPTRERQPDMEQGGCIHANMDLYKWAYKLSPWTPSELVADCFELAVAAREIDMRASPYDLAALGLPPIPVETPEGRLDYQQAQRELAARAVPLRERLIAVHRAVLAATEVLSA